MKNALYFIAISVCVISVIGTIFLSTILLVYPLKFRQEIQTASTRFDIEPGVIAAVIRAESGFREQSVSRRGAIGLMQLMPATAMWQAQKIGLDVSEDDIFNPSINILVGTAYLRYLMNRFEDLRTVLIAYNAGEGKASKWLKAESLSTERNGRRVLLTSPYPETNAYVDKVLNSIRWYSWRI